MAGNFPFGGDIGREIFNSIKSNLPKDAQDGLNSFLGNDFSASQRNERSKRRDAQGNYSQDAYGSQQGSQQPPNQYGAPTPGYGQHQPTAPSQQGSQHPDQQYQDPQHPGQQPTPPGAGQTTNPNPASAAANSSEPVAATEGPTINIVDTSTGKGDGLDKCPKCGSTEIVLRVSEGTLICQFCRYEWNEKTIDEKFGFESAISELHGIHMGSGATRIQESTDDVLTLKCGACGADVVVNTNEAMSARCHWCRNNLSVNQQVPNGAVPDGVLPFSLPKDKAIENIREFVTKRKFFAHPQFVKEFAPEEVVGVYMPYLTMDANAEIELNGTGEVQTRQYTRGSGDNKYTVYDADVYQIGRKFDLYVDDILIESSQQRSNFDTDLNTNNVINAIQPFDTKQAVSYNANYLRGYTSERRDLDVQAVEPKANGQILSVARARAGQTIRKYGRGVRWEKEQLVVHGSRWVALYVPVWLYSYYEQRGDRAFTHYVAVNGRTGATMGSVPVRKGRLIGVSTAISIVGTIVSGVIAAAWLAF
ncbi:TFIIB-type zinc ribbon-containing protein [Gulosibacter chungangensis]|uniref:TFIIB-type zinc ribbon-containing protein n=1 Tax=Gulosibacter chungangensis TaxID=979746 RepID=UPI001CE455ED|nr:TFIIB-type zinc ribbon-containing protein [Gulosibacter chungangensis]